MADENPYQASATSTQEPLDDRYFEKRFVQIARIAGPALAGLFTLATLVFRSAGESVLGWMIYAVAGLFEFVFFAIVLTIVFMIVGGVSGFLLDLLFRTIRKRGE